MSQSAFSSLNLHPELLKNLESLDYVKMTPVQEQSLPHILSGKDVIAQGKTGSGKTAAFGLGLLQKLDVSKNAVQSLVLCPTRELADQVANEIRKLARTMANIKVLTLCGGVPVRSQASSLEYGAHIIVGTPGRIEDHLRKQSLVLNQLEILVLDEADRMLDMGFQPALEAIIEQIPENRQTLLFSATFPEQIQSISKQILSNPVIVKVDEADDKSDINQHLFKVGETVDRITAVRLLLLQHTPESVVIFCNTKKETQQVADELSRYGFSVLALHGDLEQRDRDQTLIKFANKSISILVATDVAARGLDVEAVDIVINYHIAHDNEVHLHRVGRTGRAGSQGTAFTLYSEKESHKIERLEDYLKHTINTESLPPLSVLEKPAYKSNYVTLLIDGGKKQKIRPGDILGALTGKGGIEGSAVGKIQVTDIRSYVAVARESVKSALKKLEQGKLKGRSCRVRRIS